MSERISGRVALEQTGQMAALVAAVAREVARMSREAKTQRYFSMDYSDLDRPGFLSNERVEVGAIERHDGRLCTMLESRDVAALTTVARENELPGLERPPLVRS